jgi:TRAP-type C4-dicarboxylate transport system permease small subunit
LVEFLKAADRINNAFSRGLEVIGVIGMLLILLVTCVDVIGAKIFQRPVPGALDIVMQAQLAAVAFSMASTLMVGRHIRVTFLLPYIPRRMRAVVEIIIQVFCFLLFALIIWRLTVYGYGLQRGHEVSSTIKIPLYPFAYGIAVASLPMCFKYLINILQNITGMKSHAV